MSRSSALGNWSIVFAAAVGTACSNDDSDASSNAAHGGAAGQPGVAGNGASVRTTGSVTPLGGIGGNVPGGAGGSSATSGGSPVGTDVSPASGGVTGNNTVVGGGAATTRPTSASGGLSGTSVGVGGKTGTGGTGNGGSATTGKGAVFYVATDGKDGWEGSSARPWATFTHAFTKMAGGDTLIIRDGEYQDAIQSYYGDGFPSGSPDAYTTIKAEHDWRVTVHGRLVVAPADSKGYFQIQGIHFTVAADNLAFHHGKIIRCSFRGDRCTDNVGVVDIGTGSRFVLFEDCFAYGCGRYKFTAYGDQGIPTEGIIFRRCVSRHDYHEPASNWGKQCANFTSYDCHNCLFQNCIAIDSGNADPLLYGNIYGGFWFENKGLTGRDNSGTIQDSIVLNVAGHGVDDPKNNGTRIVENTVFWDTKGGYLGGRDGDSVGACTTQLDHMTIGNIWGEFGDESHAFGTGATADEGLVSAQITHSIITGCSSYGIANHVTSDYNTYFQNGADFGASWSVTAPNAGAHDRRGVNPGLRYIVRPEAGSGDYGATIMYRRGVSGTLYGEPGYDQLTDEPLWPFPNEEVIKSTMAAWDGENDPRRGFCAEGLGLYGGPVTLTSYIWEYLGAACPSDICPR